MVVTAAETGGQQVLGYVDSHIDRNNRYDGHLGPVIRLGLASSPLGPHPEVETFLEKRRPAQRLSEYPSDPHHTQTSEILLEGLGLSALGLDPKCVRYSGNGSYGMGDEFIRYFTRHGKGDLLVPNYSFPNVAQWAERHGGRYLPIITPDGSPLSAQAAMLELGKNDLESRVVYIDYPNNPTGACDPQLLADVVSHVSLQGGVPFVDFAFSEVLGEEFQALLRHTIDSGGVATGSLSKTQGLPFLRAGWGVVAPRYTKNGYGGPERMVFDLNAEAEDTLQFLYQEYEHPQQGRIRRAQTHAAHVAEYNSETNMHMYAQLESMGLRVHPSDIRTPIQVVESNVYPDLYQRLENVGIETESLSDYAITSGDDRYGNSAVRMLTPKPGQLPEVLERIAIAVE